MFCGWKAMECHLSIISSFIFWISSLENVRLSTRTSRSGQCLTTERVTKHELLDLSAKFFLCCPMQIMWLPSTLFSFCFLGPISYKFKKCRRTRKCANANLKMQSVQMQISKCKFRNGFCGHLLEYQKQDFRKFP